MATITFIDADAAAISPLKAALEQRGYTCVQQSDGHGAIDSLRQKPPEAIVLSVELPQTSGYSLCNKIKRDPLLQGVPLLLVSSQATPETFEEHKRLRTRADAYGHKPYDVAAAVAALEGLLHGSQEPQSAVERTEQARVPSLAQSPAVRFGEDPSVRDISSSPFLKGDEMIYEASDAGPEPADFASSTQVLTQEALEGAEHDGEAGGDAAADAAGFAEEQAWVERALMGLGAEGTQSGPVAQPAEEMPPQSPPHSEEAPPRTTDEDLPAPPPAADEEPPAPADDLFSRPTQALSPAEDDLQALSEARPTEVTPPKRKRATRRAAKKSGQAPAEATAAVTGHDPQLSEDVAALAQDLSRLTRALDQVLRAKEQLQQRIDSLSQRIVSSTTNEIKNE